MNRDRPEASPPPEGPAGDGTPVGHLSDRDRALLRQAEDGRRGARLLVRLLEGFLGRLSRDLTLQAAERDELKQGPVGDAALHTHELHERLAEPRKGVGPPSPNAGGVRDE